jgi:hypothetical protein
MRVTQIEAETRVNIRCCESNYELVEPFIFNEVKNTILKIKCKIDGYLWNVLYNRFVNDKTGCPKCSINKLKLPEYVIINNIKDRCVRINCNLINLNIGNSKKIRVKLKCNICEYKWETSYHHFVNDKTGCKMCGLKVNLLTKHDVENNIKNRCVIENYIYNPFIYNNCDTKIQFTCKKCDTNWETTYNNFIYCESGCPKCNESKGEKRINDYLKLKNIVFIREYKFQDCKHKRLLPFDFYLPVYSICIEFDGGLHYKAVERFGGDKGLKETQLRDQIKTDYCKNNNIKLIRIPYFEKKNIEKILDKNII